MVNSRTPLLGTALSLLTLTLLLLSYAPLTTAQIDDDKIDYASHPEWKNIRQCAQSCLVYQNGLGCSTNKCLCQPTDFKLASKAIGECSQRSCQTLDSVTTIQKFYKDYCESKGFQVDAVQTTIRTSTTTTTTAAKTSSTPVTNNQQTKTTTSSTPTNTNEPNGNNDPTNNPSNLPNENGATKENGSGGGSKSDFGTGEIIGTVVGILALIVAILTLWVNWKKKKSKELIARSVSGATRPAGGASRSDRKGVIPLASVSPAVTPPPMAAHPAELYSAQPAAGHVSYSDHGKMKDTYGHGYGYNSGQDYNQPHVYRELPV